MDYFFIKRRKLSDSHAAVRVLSSEEINFGAMYTCNGYQMIRWNSSSYRMGNGRY